MIDLPTPIGSPDPAFTKPAIWFTSGEIPVVKFIPVEAFTVASESDTTMTDNEPALYDSLTALEELRTAYEESRTPDWNSEGSEATTRGTMQRAETFLRTVPIDLPTPSIAPIPGGWISVEWHGAPGAVFSISIKEGKQLAYAGLFGEARVYGAEPFEKDFPRSLVPFVRRAFSEASIE